MKTSGVNLISKRFKETQRDSKRFKEIQRDTKIAKVEQSMPALCNDCCILFCHVLSSALFLPATEGIDAVHDVGFLDGWVLSSRGNAERNNQTKTKNIHKTA